MENEQKIVLNEQTLSQEEFAKQRAELEKEKGVSVKEVAKDTYKTRLQD